MKAVSTLEVAAVISRVSGKAWGVVTHPVIPLLRVVIPLPTVAARQAGAVLSAVASGFITIDVDAAGVSLLLIKSL